MSYQLSDNGKAVLLAAITMLGSVATMWIQSHNQHADREAWDARRFAELQQQTALLKSIEAKQPNRPPVFGVEESP